MIPIPDLNVDIFKSGIAAPTINALRTRRKVLFLSPSSP